MLLLLRTPIPTVAFLLVSLSGTRFVVGVSRLTDVTGASSSQFHTLHCNMTTPTTPTSVWNHSAASTIMWENAIALRLLSRSTIGHVCSRGRRIRTRVAQR
ncbi:hypothetical protein C7974DRAFT_402206 [Boeremia exigua]|uniref:uncharacterized protein n=1 Tax=Boeremia exigua TaxID=749465 RepID=UPI001E8D956B|nr:uncharacterized protein C7974DRAFT_402206 [Boeremia exigua]KAH6616659.1 hypothetical protein C7974DRAFT_402206 [Boeremia exigua]